MTRRVLKLLCVFISGALLCVLFYAVAGTILESHFRLAEHLREAHESDAAYRSALATLRSKNEWRDFFALPIIGCLIGVYAALVQRKRAPLLAVACLLPMLVFEATRVSVRSWALTTDLQVLASRAVEFLFAIIVAASARGSLYRQHSPSVPANSSPKS
jgi:hypothetical protein